MVWWNNVWCSISYLTYDILKTYFYKTKLKWDVIICHTLWHYFIFESTISTLFWHLTGNLVSHCLRPTWDCFSVLHASYEVTHITQHCLDYCSVSTCSVSRGWLQHLLKNHKRHHWVTTLRKCVCKCSKSSLWPSALNPTYSLCGVSLCMILDYGSNNPRHPLGNMLIAQIGNFFHSTQWDWGEWANLVSIPDPDYRIRFLDMVPSSCCQNSKPGILGSGLIFTRPRMHKWIGTNEISCCFFV